MTMFNTISFNIIVIVWLIILSLTALYLCRSYYYFKSRGIIGPKPVIFFGSLYKLFYMPFRDIIADHYKKYGRIYVYYFGPRPILMISEPRLVRDILIKDFNKFVNRIDFTTGNPFDDRQLTIALGDKWKHLRSVISPTFSSAKIRAMHPLIVNCVKSVENVLSNAAINKDEIDLRKLMGNFAMDVIASCVFATKIDTHNEPSNLFVKYAAKALRGNWKVWLSLMAAFPAYVRKFKLSMYATDVERFFTEAIETIMEKRRKTNGKYSDFLQIMIDANNESDSNDEINDESNDESKHDITKPKHAISDIDIKSTAFLFLIAGYESTSNLLTLLIYSLALHEHCQQKLYEEVSGVENLDYDTIASLPYLDACVAETERLYPSLPFLIRIASEDYRLGDTGITIPKGMTVHINVEGIHRDRQFYTNSDRFDPERFMPENRDNLVPYTYLPFGIGPRNCVGMRFSLIEAKTAIAHAIKQFKFTRTANTVIPIRFEKWSLVSIPETDIKVGVEIRND